MVVERCLGTFLVTRVVERGSQGLEHVLAIERQLIQKQDSEVSES
jgi:hypothetical protein